MLKRSFFLATIALAGGCILSATELPADPYVTGEPALSYVLPAVSGLNGKTSLKGGAL